MTVEDEEAFEEEMIPALVQSYRCPQGHVTDLVWTAGEMLIVSEAGDVRFFCRRCNTSRFASEVEALSLLAAFGLARSLRIYAS